LETHIALPSKPFIPSDYRIVARQSRKGFDDSANGGGSPAGSVNAFDTAGRGAKGAAHDIGRVPYVHDVTSNILVSHRYFGLARSERIHQFWDKIILFLPLANAVRWADDGNVQLVPIPIRYNLR
jgi:hypothetical protein